jgi:hypothetical protein
LARQDADRLTPDFSEMRHQRILRAVELAENKPQYHAQPLPRSPWRIWPAALASAAALAVAAGVGIRLFWSGAEITARQVVINQPAAPTHARPDSPTLALDRATQQVNVDVQGAMATAMAEQQWAGLDHDVRVATRYLVDQVPLRATWLGDSGAEER